MQIPIIKLLDITMSYENNTIFSNENLEIQSGEIIAAKGTIGSGKTTLLNLICGIMKPDSGRIYIDKYDITKLPSDKLSTLRAKIFGIVPSKLLLSKVKIIYFENPEIIEENSILNELESFANSINNKSLPKVTLLDGYEAIKVANEVISQIQ